MSGQPFMQLYVGDYIADTLDLTTEQHGAYLLLLMTMWRHGAKLPNDPKKLARVARVSTRRWHMIWSEIGHFFEERDGQIISPRLEREYQKAVSISQKRSVSGAKGGSANALKNNKVPLANATDLLKHSQKSEPYKEEEPNGSLSVSDKPTRKRNVYSEEFESWWKVYPTDANMSKAEAFKAWKKLDEDDRKKALVAVQPFKAWIAKQRDYRTLHAVRFLRQKRFEGYAEQVKPQLVHSTETVQISVHEEPEFFDKAMNWSRQHVQGFVECGQEHLKIPAGVAAKLRKNYGRPS